MLKNKILIVCSLLMLVGCTLVSESSTNVEARSNKKEVAVEFKRIDNVTFNLDGRNGKYLLYNKTTHCIYTSDLVPIAEQIYTLEGNKCTGYYQQFIPKK